MAANQVDHYDLSSVDFNGLVNEDVMDTIWDISNVPLPFTDMVGTDECGNEYKEWTTDELQPPDKTNATIDGAAAAGDDTNLGERLGNHCQIPDKRVVVSHRAQAANTIGRSDELAYQIMMRQRELRRDVEAICLAEYGSAQDTGAVAGRSAGLFAFIRGKFDNQGPGSTLGNALVGATTGWRPGFANGIVDGSTYGTTNFAVGTTRALTETFVRDAVQMAYEDGGDPTVMMMIPTLCRKFSEYLFTASARVASLYSETGQEAQAATAKGSVNIFVTDFGTVELIPNRIMQAESTGVGTERTNVGILDPNYLSIGYLEGYRTEPLGKAGTADDRQMTVDFCLIVNSLDAHATICDIDYTAAVTT